MADGCFLSNGDFVLLPREMDTEKAEQLFRHNVLSMLLHEGRVTKLTVEKLLTWYHTGFNCHVGERIEPDEKERREHLGRYLVRPPLALDKLTYLPEEGKVLYGPRHDRKTFHPLDFLAELTQHIPDHYKHRVHYFGAFSSRSRGAAAKAGEQAEPQIKESTLSRKSCNRAWAALISKVYVSDPLECPRCKAQMKIIAFIQEDEPVKKILKHLNLWDYPRRAPPRKVPLPIQQILFPRRNEKQALRYPTGDEYDAPPALMAADSCEGYYTDPETPIEYFAVDPEPEHEWA